MKIKTTQYAFWAALALGATSLANADTLVTFQVDMTQQIAGGSFTPGVNAINARGTFNGYGTYALTNDPSSGNPNLYTGTVDDTSDANGAQLQYKYCIDSGGWENPSDGCNRFAVLPATSGASLLLPAVYFSDASPGGATVTDNVTFQVDMTEQIVLGNFDPSVNVINARGGFNSWGTTTLTNNPNAANTNLYSMVVPVTDTAANTEQYKFCIDTGGWENPGAVNQNCGGNRIFNLLPTSDNVTLPVVYFDDVAPAPPVTNTVTFQVDMSIQAALGHFDSSVDTVECRGSFNNWNANNLTPFPLTNNPSAVNSNLYSGTINIVTPPTNIFYKFWDSDAAVSASSGYESPVSTGGQNRTYNLSNVTATIVVPNVYFADLASTVNFLTEDTLVTFTVNMTNALTTTEVPFDPSSDIVSINGDWIPWWAWADFVDQPYLAYQMVNNPVGSGLYSITLTIPKGNSLALTYKFSINGSDNELPAYVNHFRYVRNVGSYTLPLDKFGTQVTEPQLGALTIGAPSGGSVPVSWLGLPAAYLQTSPSLSSPAWVNHPETAGYGSPSGIYSTNYPMSGDALFFRVTNP